MIRAEKKEFHDNFPYYFYNIYKRDREIDELIDEHHNAGYPAANQICWHEEEKYWRLVCKIYTSKEDTEKIVNALKEWDSEKVSWREI